MNFITLSNGRKIAYAEYGDPAGSPAFYFHGWPSSGIQGSLMDEAGRELGLRIISPDRPGLGQSDFHPGRRLLDWPPLLGEMAAQLGIGSFHVFGVSGGGPYVLAAAHVMAERLLTASIVSGAPPLRLFGTQDLFWVYRAALVLRRHLNFMLDPLFRAGARISNGRPDAIPMRWLLAMLGPEDRRVMSNGRNLHVVSEGFRQSIRQSVKHAQADADIYLEDWGFDLRSIRHPIHLWHGREDQNIPISYAEKLAALLPHATTHWTDRDGHYSLAISRGRDVAATALGM
ncbi:MAG: alpha/beta hydrolase [Verrucomicrobiaceae bacterium]|nr:alpha/beta hydrolase [Verrucomicrobiaceae bacterium]